MAKTIDVVMRLQDKFTERMKKIENQTRSSMSSMKQGGSTMLSGISQHISNSVTKFAASSKSIAALGKSVRRSSKTMYSFGSSMTKAVTMPLVGVGAASVKSAMDFETSFNKLKTIADTNKKTGLTADQLKKQLRGLSDQTGQSQSALAEATYQAISAGQSTKKAVSFVAQAGKLAKGGSTDMSTATDTLTTVMNAYGKAAGSAESISSKLIMTQNLGKTTVGELGATMGKVVSTANMYKVGLNQLASAYVTTTKNGVNTAQSTTLINSLLSQLGKGSTKAAKALKTGTGHTFEELMKKGWSLTDVVKAVDKQSKKSGKTLGETFNSVTATKGAATLLQHTKDFTGALGKMKNASGLAGKAAATMANSTANKLKVMKEQINNIAIDIGSTIIPMLSPIVARVSSIIKRISNTFKSMSTESRQHIIKLLGIVATIGPAFMVFGKIGMTVGKTLLVISDLSAALRNAGGVLALITSPAGITMAVIAGLAAATVLVIANWGKIKKVAKSVWSPIAATLKNVGSAFNSVVSVFKTGVSKIRSAGSATGKSIAKIFNPVRSEARKLNASLAPARKAFASLAKAVKSSIKAAGAKLIALAKDVAKMYAKIRPYISLVESIFKSVFKARLTFYITSASNVFKVFLSTVSGVVSGVLRALRGIIDFVTGVFTGDWRKAWNGVKNIFAGVMQGLAAVAKAPMNAVIGIINGAISGINSIHVEIPDWVPKLGGKKFGVNIAQIPYLAKGTKNWAGGPAHINEKGGEIVDLPRGTRVYPHDKSITLVKNENDNLKAIILGMKSLLTKARNQSIEVTNNVNNSKLDNSSKRYSEFIRSIKNAFDRSVHSSYERTLNQTSSVKRFNKQNYKNDWSRRISDSRVIKSERSNRDQRTNTSSVNRVQSSLRRYNDMRKNSMMSSAKYDAYSSLARINNSNASQHAVTNNQRSSVISRIAERIATAVNNYDQQRNIADSHNVARTSSNAVKKSSSVVSHVMSKVADNRSNTSSVNRVQSSLRRYNDMRKNSMMSSAKYDAYSSLSRVNNSNASQHAVTNNQRSSVVSRIAERVANAVNNYDQARNIADSHNVARTSSNAVKKSSSVVSQVMSKIADNRSNTSSVNRVQSSLRRYNDMRKNSMMSSAKYDAYSSLSRVNNSNASQHAVTNNQRSSVVSRIAERVANAVNNYDQARNIADSHNVARTSSNAVKKSSSVVSQVMSKIADNRSNTSSVNRVQASTRRYNDMRRNSLVNRSSYDNRSTLSRVNNYSNSKKSSEDRRSYSTRNSSERRTYDQRNYTINISKLADVLKIDGNQDIDDIAKKLADKLKLELANMS